MPFRIQSVSSQVSAAALRGVDLPILKKNSKEQVDTEDSIHAKCAVLSRPANISKSFMRPLQYLWLFSNVSSANPDIHSNKYFHIYLTVFIRKHLTIQRCVLNAVGDLPLQFCQLCGHGLTRPFGPPHCHWYAKHVLFHSKTELAVWVWQPLSFSCTGGCGFTISFKKKKKIKKIVPVGTRWSQAYAWVYLPLQSVLKMEKEWSKKEQACVYWIQSNWQLCLQPKLLTITNPCCSSSCPFSFFLWEGFHRTILYLNG